MKKMLMAVIALALAGVAGAQKITFESNKNFYMLQGCYFIKEGLRCDLTYTAAADGRVYFNADSFEVVTVDGSNIEGEKIAAAGGGWTNSTSYINVYSGVPIKLSVLFKDVPTSNRTLAVFAAYKSSVRNVTIGGATPAPAPATAAPAQTINIAGNWNATLTNCKQTSAGVVVCTATLRK